MTGKIKVGQIWRNKTTNDRVKVMKLLPGYVKLFDMDGSNYGKQDKVENNILITKYRLIKNV